MSNLVICRLNSTVPFDMVMYIHRKRKKESEKQIFGIIRFYFWTSLFLIKIMLTNGSHKYMAPNKIFLKFRMPIYT